MTVGGWDGGRRREEAAMARARATHSPGSDDLDNEEFSFRPQLVTRVLSDNTTCYFILIENYLSCHEEAKSYLWEIDSGLYWSLFSSHNFRLSVVYLIYFRECQ